MSSVVARLASAAVAVLFVLSAAAQDVPKPPQKPWDAPAFSVEPAALLAAAATVPAAEDGVVLLLDEAQYSFEADGRSRTVTRLMYRVDTQAAIGNNDQITATWAPWHDDKPVLAARVITRDGTVHMLDEKAIAEAPARDSSLDIFSDNRIVRAPLPAVAVGSIVEYTITTAGRSPIEGSGLSGVFAFGRWVPLERARLVIEGPASIQPRIVNRTEIEPAVEEKDGRRRMTFVSGRLPEFEHLEDNVPFDDAAYPYVAFSTGTTWQNLATRYSKIVDEQIAGSDLRKMVRTAIGNAKAPRDIAARALAAIQKEIRYAGVEIAEGSIIPRSPATVLKNKYGDCKDKAVLLVAMLREAGLTAHVALLRAGDDLDAHDDLPGLGRFNHAIVRVESKEGPIWIDPTDEFARAGELPIADQGRMALIAAPATTTLTRTPELPSTSNLYAETRIYNLAEHGRASVIEITETTGPSDAAQRRFYVNSTREKYRESMESYAKSHYLAKALETLEVSDPHDLATPFKLTLGVKESRSGSVLNGEAVVAVSPVSLFSDIPETLRNWTEPQPDDDPKKAPKPRVRDFVFPEPIVKEWTYRIVPPAGYLARTLPAGEKRQLGTTTYTSDYTGQADGTVIARFRIDSGKRRITAAEYETTRVAVSKLLDEPQINIGFDLAGQAKLNAGDVGGALAEFRRLAALHPKEAQHQMELASALLAGGLAESARDQARRAVATEPKNARAHATLGHVLQHDLLGRRRHRGWDPAGALDALRKAKELDPENLEARIELARLLSYGTDGTQFGAGAQLTESIAEFRAIAKDFGDDAKPYDGELMMILAHAGKFDDLKTLAESNENDQARNVGRLIAVAAAEGKDAALRELGKFAIETRRTYATNLMQHFMDLRLYPEAAAMLELATQGTPTASSSTALIEVLKKARRVETVGIRDDHPDDILSRLFALFVRNASTDDFLEILAPDLRAEGKKEMEEEAGSDPVASMTAGLRAADIRPVVMADLVRAMTQVSKDGSETAGYRVRHRVAGSDENMTVYVTNEGGKYLMRGFEGTESVGEAALRFVELNQLDHARIWLNWAREAVTAGDAEDPLSRPSFAMLWPKAKPTATADEIRVAAAAQIADYDDDKVALLEELREKATTDAARIAIDRGLASAYTHGRHWVKLVPVARRLMEAHPDSAFAFNGLGTALSFTGKHDESAAIAKARLERIPNDRDALRILAQNAAASRDFAAAEKYAQQVIDQTTPKGEDFNNAAWYGLFTGNLERALTHAVQATAEESKPDAKTFHTLATIYADADKPLEAHQALLNSLSRKSNDQPTGADWYIVGRIAETYGVRDAATAAYKRVPKAKENDHDSGMEQLVARRIAKLK